MLRLFSIFAIFLLLCACSQSNVESDQSSETNQAITQAILVYVTNHTAVLSDNIKVESIVESGSYARAKVVPTNPNIADTAIVFLKHSPKEWEVISLGTAFDHDFYIKNHIPVELQLN